MTIAVIESRMSLAERVDRIVMSTPITDIHTHLYDPALGDLLLWGIDDLLVYHYLVAEAFRYLEMPFDRFWSLSKNRQAEIIWEALFLERSPISESCRGVLTTLNLLGLDVRKRDLTALRKWFQAWKASDYVDHCLKLAGVGSVFMTNSPFDGVERSFWNNGFARDERFIAALRIDPLLVAWNETAPFLREQGYPVELNPSERSFSEVRRFLDSWTGKIRAKYLMTSLGPDFNYPTDDLASRLLEKAILPHCRDAGLPMALMLGVKRSVNPGLSLAGDGIGLSQLGAVERICAQFPGNKFLVTVLARENQHELCVLARKFRNLHIFGCWWFTNVPSIIEEMTRMRLELIGLSVTPQHSDSRVLDQLIYKWRHFRQIISRVLAEKYADLEATGWMVTDEEIGRDVRDLFGGAFDRFCSVKLPD